MAQPQITKVKWGPQNGGLNADIDPKDLRSGDLLVTGVNTGAKNVRAVGRGTGVSPSYEPVWGNEAVYQLDPLVVQNKKWRIYVDCSETPLLINEPNIVLNGSFATDINNWQTNIIGSWIWNAGGYAEHIPGSASLFFQSQTGIDPGVYRVQFTIVSRTAGYITLPLNQFLNAQYNANGTYIVDYPVVVDTSGNFSVFFFADSAFDGGIDNVVITKIGEVFTFNTQLLTPSNVNLGSLFTSHFPICNNISDTLLAISNWLLYSDFSIGISTRNPLSTYFVTGPYTGYVEFELTDYQNFNYDFSIIYNQVLSNINDCVKVVISQEAVDPGCIGDWNLIGSDDAPGDSFQFWTTRRGLQEDVEVFDISQTAPLIVTVTTAVPHGLVENQAIIISNVIGAANTIGTWTAINVTPTTFDIANCTNIGGPYISGGLVSKFIYGVGEIGVAVKDDQGVINYTRLLRSIEFNFTTLKQIDVRVKRKQDTQKYAAYFTDNFNVPRVFYYKGPYITDGALEFVSSDNIYEYGKIANEIRWLINNEDFRIDVIGQTESGGSLKSGTWRYTARFLTSNFTETNWSKLTEGVPVFFDVNTDVDLIGSVSDVVCNKVNQLQITNNMPGIFTYVEIGALHYFNDTAPSGYIIGRFPLTQENVQLFNHTGYEADLIDLDVGSINDFSPGFIKAQNVELLDNRAILSNLTPIQIIDFTEWVKTYKYSLNRFNIGGVGTWSGGTGNLRVGEYQDPMTVYDYKSHMMMETYRYGFRFKLKNGSLTQVFYPGYDITIDLPASLPPSRLPGTFTSFDLTNQATGAGTPTDVYSIYISWEGINLGFKIDGVPAYDLIDEIIPCRAKVIPEVLLSGNIALGVSGTFNDNSFLGGLSGPDIITSSFSSSNYITAYPLAFGGSGNGPNSPTVVSDIYPGNNGDNDFTAQRRSFFLYAPDSYFDLIDIENLFPGDELYVFGSPTRHSGYTAQTTSPPGMFMSYYREWDGFTNITQNPTPYTFTNTSSIFTFKHPASFQNIVIDGLTHINYLTYIVAAQTPGSPTILPVELNNEKSIAGRVSVGITDNNSAGNNDYGFYRAIYFRPIPNKYGDPINTLYTEQLNQYIIGDNKGVVPSGDFNTFGDCFTQKSYLKQRYPGRWDWACDPLDNLPPAYYNCGTWFGWGGCLAFYTQNRNNIQLRTAVNDTFDDSYLATKVTLPDWITIGYAASGSTGYNVSRLSYLAPAAGGRDAQLYYNTGYTPVNNITSVRAYNPLLEYQTDWGNAIAWSDAESEGSNTDNLRNFPPLNLKFLDFTQGPITDARVLNGRFFTIQSTEVQEQFFNNTSMFGSTTGEVYLGTGAIMRNRGNTANRFGSRHKWSIIKALSDKGGDVLYGIDDINNTVWRLGYDGTNALDEIQGMKSFFANNLQWIRGKYTPAHDDGIRGVSNQRYREIMWTLRGRKLYPEWQAEENISYVLTFNENLSNELIVNPNFAGTLSGWESLDTLFAPDPTIWELQYILSISNYAANKTALEEGYLAQSTPIPFVAGRTYRIEVGVPIAPSASDVEIRFQAGGPLAYATSTSGTFIFSYVAQPGDDNIYIYNALGSDAYVNYVSVREVLSNANWNGGIDWVLSTNSACTIGLTSTSLADLSPTNYIIPNLPWQVTLVVDSYVSGDLTLSIGNVNTAALGITGTGTYTIGATPTLSGVISIVPSPDFEGCVKGNILVETTGTPKVYNAGDVVTVSSPVALLSSWSQTPDIYLCLNDGTTSNPLDPPIDPNDPDWQLIPHTDNRYYTEYTIVYNELKNRFQAFHSILPRIYATFQSQYLVPRPISNTGRMYISDSGIPTSWFEGQQEDAFFDAVINQPLGRKRYLAVRVESDVAPTTMDVSSVSGASTTIAAEFEQREGEEFDGYVKDDPGSDSIIQGDYGLFRFTFAATTYNKFNSFIASVRERARKWFR